MLQASTVVPRYSVATLPAVTSNRGVPGPAAIQRNQTVAANGAVPQAATSPVSDVAPVLSTVSGTPVVRVSAAARSSFDGRGELDAVTVMLPALAQLSAANVQAGWIFEPTWTR